MPQAPEIKKAILGSIKAHLTAWDPVAQREVWRVERPGLWNGGALSTAGNLVFEGTGYGQFEAFRATTGEKLWSASTESGVTAGPISYSVNGEQYIAVVVGWGGVLPLAAGEAALQTAHRKRPADAGVQIGRQGQPARGARGEAACSCAPMSTASAARVKRGEKIYQRFCGGCHGDVAVSGGVLPGLRYSGTLADDQWFQIVLNGMLESYSMVNFSKELSKQDAAAVREYVIARANQSLAAERHVQK